MSDIVVTGTTALFVDQRDTSRAFVKVDELLTADGLDALAERIREYAGHMRVAQASKDGG